MNAFLEAAVGSSLKRFELRKTGLASIFVFEVNCCVLIDYFKALKGKLVVLVHDFLVFC